MSSGRFTHAVRHALKVQAAAAEHLRDCERCRHLFEVAYEETMLLFENEPPNLAEGQFFAAVNPFNVTAQIRRELRACPDWPKGI